MPNSGKSYDLLDGAGRQLQVKARTIGDGVRASAKFSAFRSFDFDFALFITFDLTSYEVIWARLVPRDELKSAVSYSPHVNGSSVRITSAAKLGSDVTDRVFAAARGRIEGDSAERGSPAENTANPTDAPPCI